MTGDCSFEIDSIDEEGELQLVTGSLGVGKTSFGLALAEEEEQIISNLESVQRAYYANSPDEVKSVLRLNPETRFAVLLDDITANLSYDAERRQIVELVSELVDLGHRVILTGTVLGDFPAELLYYREGEWDGAAGDAYHLPERGQVEYREIYRIGGQLDARTICSLPAARPSRMFYSQEIPEFEFDADDSGENQEEKSLADRDLFNPEEKFPPQFHYDYLNMELEYDIEEADGFFDLDWGAKCDLLKLAVDHDLELSEVETILELDSEGDESC